MLSIYLYTLLRRVYHQLIIFEKVVLLDFINIQFVCIIFKMQAITRTFSKQGHI
jgi:hypothetical protein